MNASAIARLALMAFPIMFAGCATRSATPANITGRYELRGKGHFAGESITLRPDATFERITFTDVATEEHPYFTTKTVGRYRVQGRVLKLESAGSHMPGRVLTQRYGRFVLWSLEDYEDYLHTRRVSPSVLFQNRGQ